VASSVFAKPRYLVLIVLDGARPDYFGLAALPHVDALRKSGTQFTQAIDGILEAETPSGHATIATGTRPDSNGLLGFDWANDNDRVSLFDPSQMGNLEQLLQDSHAPTIAGLYKQQYPQARVVALSGHKYYAAAPLGGPDADAIMYYQGDPKGRYVPVAVPGHAPPASVLNTPGLIAPTTNLGNGGDDHLATKLALAAVNKMRPRLLLINYPEFDWPLGHVDGGPLSPATVITDMKVFDADLGLIEDAYRKAGILDQTLFVITADHGMMPITRLVPASVVTNAVTQAGTTAPNIASASAALPLSRWVQHESGNGRRQSVPPGGASERSPAACRRLRPRGSVLLGSEDQLEGGSWRQQLGVTTRPSHSGRTRDPIGRGEQLTGATGRCGSDGAHRHGSHAGRDGRPGIE
jgi:hypothetical protein